MAFGFILAVVFYGCARNLKREVDRGHGRSPAEVKKA
jgi:hypothetical protein